MSLVGSVLSGRYEILEEIGEGGMATVYKAKCKLLNRYVAVKVLRGEFAKDSQFVKRFRAEAQSAASLAHPNIVSVYDVGEENGINYIVMECLEGKTLKDYIEENGKLSNLATLKFASQIASALEAAHKAKIIHRDIKPQNIVFSSNENVVKVTDFGIAKMISTNTITSQSATMGSVHYFSPEHAKGCYIDEKSDIYSLGIVMYEMATGKLPFDADTAVSVALKQIQEEPKAPKEVEPTVSEDLNAIILKAIQKNSLNRYKSATEMLDDIFAAINNPGHIFKPETKVVAGGTQVIPIIGLKNTDTPSIGDVEESVIELSRKNNRPYVEVKKDSMDSKVQEEVSKYQKDLGENSKKKKKLIIIIVSIVAAICVGVIAFMTIKLIGNFNREKEETKIQIEIVPELVGEDFEEARKAYAKKGYTIELDKYEYSSEVEEGNIISQSIKAGEKITSDKITVVVSKGQKLVTMIDVVGKDYTVAKYELESLGLVPEFEFEQNDKIEKNIIIEQDIKAKEEIAVGSTIVIKVSEGNGKATIIVPNVVGDNGEEAKKTLELLMLDVSIDYAEDVTKANGVVLKQSATENTELEEGSKITLTVNRLQKSKTVTIDLTGMIPTQSTEGEGTVEGEGTETPSTPTSVTLKVTATVEGVTNTIIQDRTITAEDKVEVTVNGFTTATLKIYINGEYKGEQKVTFD